MTAIGLGRAVISITVVLFLVAPSARAEAPGPSTSAPASGSEQARPAEHVPYSEPAGSVAGRVVAEVMMGSGLGTVGFLAGPRLAGAACSKCRSAAGFAGATAMFPLGVYWGGGLVRGKGSFWLTVAAPWIASATTFVALARDTNYDAEHAVQIGLVGGAIAAPLSIVLYELSHAWNRASASRASAASQVHVAIGPRQGGVGFLVSWRPEL
jgi:hypothetical protein